MFTVEIFKVDRDSQAGSVSHLKSLPAENDGAAKTIIEVQVARLGLVPTKNKNIYRHKEYTYLIFTQPV